MIILVNYTISAISVVMIVYCVFKCIRSNETETIYYGIDTIYSTKVLDTIQYNIKHHDSTIITIKHKLHYEIEEAKTNSDTAAVNQFKRLASE